MALLSAFRDRLLAPFREPGSIAQMFALAIVFALPSFYLLLHDQYSLLTFLVVAAAFIISWTFNKTGALLFVLAYLFLLGDIRRIVNMYAGYPRLDPLLVVGSAFSIYLTVPLLLKVRVSDGLSKAVLAITALMTFEIVNPRQGPLAVGAAGALFFLIPMCWFWIARQYATERILFLILYRTVLPLGVFAALLGFYQTYVGFPPWQQLWIKHAVENGYVALGLGGGHTRSFGYSVNSVEYGTLLMLSSVCATAAVYSGRRAYALFLPILVSAQLLASMRGLLLKTVLAFVMMWAVRGQNPRAWIGRLVLGLILGFGLLGYSVRHATADAPSGPGKTSADVATSHVTQGLAHPLDSKYSTAGLHTQMFLGGIAYGFKNPLGAGLGSVTLGAGKFGGGAEGAGASEVDISDVFTTNGFIGGFLYLAMMGIVTYRLFRFVLTGPRVLSLALLGVFIGMLGEWIPLGQYAAGPFIWFCIGFLANKRVMAGLQGSTASADEEPSGEFAPEYLDEVPA